MKITGHIRGLSTFYAEDGLERMEIWINKENAANLPYEVGQRIPIELIIKMKYSSPD